MPMRPMPLELDFPARLVSVSYPVTVVGQPQGLESCQTLAAPIRSMGRRLSSHWRFIVVRGGLVLILASIALTMLNTLSWQAERSYQQAVAEADRLDPGWRLDDILATPRESFRTMINSALRVRQIAEKLPGGWPGIKPYDAVLLSRAEHPRSA